MKRNDRRQDDSWQDYPEGQEDFSVHYEDDFGEPQDTYDDGYDDGYGDSGGYSDTAYDGGYAASYSEGYDDSYNDGYDDGYSDYDGGYGYDDGYGGYDSYDGGGYDDGAYYDESPEPGPSPKKRRREKKAREGKPAKPKKKFRPLGCLWSILWKLLILAVVAVVGFTGFLFVRLEPVDFPSAGQVIGWIHAAGGIAVLAHPGASLKDGTDVDTVLTLPLDGVEVFTSYHNAAQTAFYLEKTQQKGLLVTGGSDFHGRIKPDLEVGDIDFSGMESKVREKLLAALD